MGYPSQRQMPQGPPSPPSAGPGPQNAQSFSENMSAFGGSNRASRQNQGYGEQGQGQGYGQRQVPGGYPQQQQQQQRSIAQQLAHMEAVSGRQRPAGQAPISQNEGRACPSTGWQYIDPKGNVQGPFTHLGDAAVELHGILPPRFANEV